MKARRLVHLSGRSVAIVLLALGCAACATSAGSSSGTTSRAASRGGASPAVKARASHGGRLAGAAPVATTAATTSAGQTASSGTTSALPGAGHPPILLGDKNYTEQEVLGQLWAQALQAQGYTVSVNQNIGPTSVTMQALKNGSLMVYPEYLSTFDTAIAGYSGGFRNASAAYVAATRWASRNGLVLLRRTPFSDTYGIAVTDAFAAANGLRSLFGLRRVATTMTVGGPAQFDTDPPGLAQVAATYGVTPAAFKAVPIGDQYSALDSGKIQAAYVNTTDGQLATGDYFVLDDSKHVFGFGNVIPVISAKAVATEGAPFVNTIECIDTQLKTSVMRELNQLVDVAQQSPATVAHQFLETHGLLGAQPCGQPLTGAVASTP
ncbi:MAG: ABC transporter substrate-binding protein [Solirubrobacteraceae bacterium]